MKKIYIFLTALLVSLSSSARIVFFDNSTSLGDGDLMCHTFNSNGSTSIPWNDATSKMTSIGNDGYVFKVNENNDPDKVLFHIGDNQSAQYSIVDGGAYNKTSSLNAVKVVLRGTNGKWTDFVTFTYNNDNTFVAEATVDMIGVTALGINIYMGGNEHGWLTFGGELTEDNLKSGVTVKSGGGTTTTNISGTFTFVLDFSDTGNITLRIDTEEEPADQVLEFDQPAADEKLKGFNVWGFSRESGSTSDQNKKKLTAQLTDEDNIGGLYYSWVKYEDDAVYTSGNGTTDGATLHKWSDNPIKGDDNKSERYYSIDQNNTVTHNCRNFSKAYYRFYHESETRPSAKAGSESQAAVKSTSGWISKDNLKYFPARVARTIAAPDNTTGVDGIVVDGGGSVDDSDAPVVYYNLQGVQVKNPSKGLYIRVQGKKADKVYVK